MNFDDYQLAAQKTADPDMNFNYVPLAIVGEAGEIAELFKKFYHHRVEVFKDGDFYQSLRKELGDLLWGLSNAASFYGFRLDDIARDNLEKLEQRYPHGFVRGGGIRGGEVRPAYADEGQHGGSL